MPHTPQAHARSFRDLRAPQHGAGVPAGHQKGHLRLAALPDAPHPAPSPTRRYRVYGLDWTNGIPFPSEDAYRPGSVQAYLSLPYLAFNYLGQLVSGQPGRDEYIPIARGTVAFSRDPATKKPRPGLPTLIENPAGNATNSFNLIHIDRLTGRARLIQQDISGT